MKRMLVIALCITLLFSLLASCAARQPLTVGELLELGERFLLEHEYEQALVQFLGVIEVDPMNSRGYTGAVEAYDGLGRIDDAEAILEQGLTVLLGNPEISDVLAGFYIASGRLDDAMELVQRGLSNTPNHPGLLSRNDELAMLLHTHTWVDANCSTPRTCSECGETEGAPLSHSWRDANFQEPRTCSVCGETEGTPQTPGFLKSGHQINMTLGGIYQYRTVTSRDRTLHTIGEASFSDFRVFRSEEGLEAIDGYEYQSITLRITFSDGNAQRFGVSWAYGILDYYTFNPLGTSTLFSDMEDSEIPGFLIWGTVNYYGEDWELHFLYSSDSGWEDSVFNATANFTFLAPIGYDGIIIYPFNYLFFSEDEEQPVADTIDEDTLFFRLID